MLEAWSDDDGLGDGEPDAPSCSAGSWSQKSSAAATHGELTGYMMRPGRETSASKVGGLRQVATY